MKNIKDLWTEEVVLDGNKMRLEPLGLQHLESLSRHVIFPRQFVSEFGGCLSTADVEKEIHNSIKARSEHQENGFAMVLKESNEAIGYTYYLSLLRPRFTLDIGRTRISPQWHKTFVNTEVKYLMLKHAFEVFCCQRVGLKADSLNFNSQRAIRRIGAKFEGEIRHYLRLPDGRKRDYHSFSIIDTEWPNVKATLQGYMEKYNVSP